MKTRKLPFSLLLLLMASCATQKDVKQVESNVKQVETKVDVLSSKTVESKSELASSIDELLEKQHKRIDQWKKETEGEFQVILKNQADLKADFSSISEKLNRLSGRTEETDHFIRRFEEKITRMEERIKLLNALLMESQLAQGQREADVRALEARVKSFDVLLMESQLTQSQQMTGLRRDMLAAAEAMDSAMQGLERSARNGKPDKTAKDPKADKAPKAIKDDKSALKKDAAKKTEAKKEETTAPAAPASEKSPEELYRGAYRNFLKADFAAAAAEFAEYVKRFPDADLGGNSQFWLGESLANMEKMKEAREAFELTEIKYPRSSKAPTALLRAAEIAATQGDLAAARAFLGKIRDNYPATLEGTMVDERLKALTAHTDKE